jgi:hypothetical protein
MIRLPKRMLIIDDNHIIYNVIKKIWFRVFDNLFYGVQRNVVDVRYPINDTLRNE